MSWCKLCWFTTLATVVIFAAVKTLRGQLTQFGLFTRNSQPHQTEFAPHGSISESQPPNALFQARSISSTHSNGSQTVFLPVQSKNPEDLGLGKLLVASRSLTDPIFAKTVVLLVHYDADSVVGLMVNRRSDVPLSRAFDQLKAAKNRSDPIYLGGPVEISAVFALLRSKARQEQGERLLEDVYLISTKSAFEKTLSAQPDSGVFHVYLGYAGWTPDQLRKEVELGAWFIFPSDAQTVFTSDPDGLWSQMIRKTELKMASGKPADAAAIQQISEDVTPAAPSEAVYQRLEFSCLQGKQLLSLRMHTRRVYGAGI
jgi:putative transcriptional regulator